MNSTSASGPSGVPYINNPNIQQHQMSASGSNSNSLVNSNTVTNTTNTTNTVAAAVADDGPPPCLSPTSGPSNGHSYRSEVDQKAAVRKIKGLLNKISPQKFDSLY